MREKGLEGRACPNCRPIVYAILIRETPTTSLVGSSGVVSRSLCGFRRQRATLHNLQQLINLWHALPCFLVVPQRPRRVADTCEENVQVTIAVSVGIAHVATDQRIREIVSGFLGGQRRELESIKNRRFAIACSVGSNNSPRATRYEVTAEKFCGFISRTASWLTCYECPQPSLAATNWSKDLLRFEARPFPVSPFVTQLGKHRMSGA